MIVLGASKDPDLIRDALRAGARDFLAAGEEGELAGKMLDLLQASGEFQLAQVTAFFPAKGGMGATSLATHLAGALARQGRRVCLVDLDFELGDVLSFLDMKGTYTLADVAANTHRLDRELLDASVPRHASGVWVLSQCDAVADGERLDPGAVAGVLRFLRRHYDHVVVDGLRDFGDLAFAALDVATRIALVVTQEVPAVRSAQRCAAYFGQLGYDSGRLLLLVNRYHKGSPITREVDRGDRRPARGGHRRQRLHGPLPGGEPGRAALGRGPPLGRGPRHGGAGGVHRAGPGADGGSRRRCSGSSSLRRRSVHGLD